MILYSARTQKATPRNQNSSGGKNSKQSSILKIKNKIHSISQIQLKLRQSINCKFERSKIKSYQYITNYNSTLINKNKIFQNNSQDLSDHNQYSYLIGQKFINLKEYHNKTQEQPQKKYLIRLKFSQNKKSTYKQQPSLKQNNIQDNNLKHRIFAKNKNLQLKLDSNNNNKKIFSNQKYCYSPTIINSLQKRSASQQQEKSRLFFFRKERKFIHSKQHF